jgi:hypothetical protein
MLPGKMRRDYFPTRRVAKDRISNTRSRAWDKNRGAPCSEDGEPVFVSAAALSICGFPPMMGGLSVGASLTPASTGRLTETTRVSEVQAERGSK